MNESADRAPLSRRTLLRYGLGTLGASALAPTVLAACGGSSSSDTSPTTSKAPATTATAGGAQQLEAARAEGSLIAAAIGEEHSYYEPVIAGFEKQVGFEVELPVPTYPAPAQVAELAEDAAAEAPPRYDVIEVTQATAADAKADDLLEPYVSEAWSQIPSILKDPDGAWAAAYFGVVSFITNTTATDGFLPGSWEELRTSPDTPKGSFAMLGDPRTGQPMAGGLALLTVMSAALANGGDLDNVEPGLELLGELVEKGIFDLEDQSSLLALPDTSGTRSTPIGALLSFDMPYARYRGDIRNKTIESAAPSDGLVAGFYPQAIAARAQHPEAAKAWIDYIQSDEGAKLFLQNGAIPSRHAAIAESGSAELRELLPPEDQRNAPVPLPAQIADAQQVIDDKWTQYVPVGK